MSEGAHLPERVPNTWKKAAGLMALIVVPGVAAIVVFGGPLPSLFGSSYGSAALDSLRLLALAGIPLALNTLYVQMRRIQMRVREPIYIWGVGFVVTIGERICSLTFSPPPQLARRLHSC